MDQNKIVDGMRVRTTEVLYKSDPGVFRVASKNLDARQANKEGFVLGRLPGHRGNVWWVKHDDETVGAYLFAEFNAV